MTILIASDAHRNTAQLRDVILRSSPLDMLIYLGDAEGGEESIRRTCLERNPDCEIHMVRGNCDFFGDLPEEKEIAIGPYKAFLTHGHLYGVSGGPGRLLREAKERGAQIAMFGHTHRPFLETMDGITLVNPGSITLPRQDGRRRSYILMEIDREGEAHYTINYV